MEVNLGVEVDGKTLEDFARLIEQRRNLLNETTEQSVSACAINLLKSLRASTLVAHTNKPYSEEPVEHANLMLGFKSIGKKKVPCLRVVGSKDQFSIGNKASLFVIDKSLTPQTAKVFSWKRRSGRVYYIVSSGLEATQKWIKDIEKKRIQKYRGLAKHALGRLMHKVASTSITDNIDAAAQTVAEQNTNVVKQSTGFNSGKYSLTMNDELRYALDALKGGQAEVNSCLQRAMNSITSIINNKCKNMLGFEKLEIPFPKN